MDYELKFNPPSSPDIPYPSQTIKNTFDLRMCSKEEFKINDDDYRKPASGAFFIHVDAWYTCLDIIEKFIC